MEFYMKVMFWMGAVNFVFRIILMGIHDFPRTTKETLGGYIAQTLLGLAFMIWAGILLWGKAAL